MIELDTGLFIVIYIVISLIGNTGNSIRYYIYFNYESILNYSCYSISYILIMLISSIYVYSSMNVHLLLLYLIMVIYIVLQGCIYYSIVVFILPHIPVLVRPG